MKLPRLLPRYLTIATVLFAATFAHATASEGLPKATVMEAVQRGVLGKLPVQFTLQDAQFTVVSSIDAVFTIKGEAVFIANEDTFIGIRRLSLKRPSGELSATIIRPVHKAGATFSAPFQGVISLLYTGSRIVPSLDVGAQGKPRSNYPASVVEGTPEQQRLLTLDEAFVKADERAQRVKDKWSKLLKIRDLLTNYDEFTSKKWTDPFNVGQLLERGLDDNAVRKTYSSKISRTRDFPNRQAQHAAFVQLVTPVFNPEYTRINAIISAQSAAVAAYVDFLEKL